jgi:hypothetical protein
MRGISVQDAPSKDADTLSRLPMPVLVTAHPYDPLHAREDAAELVAGLSNAQRVDLRSIADYALRQNDLNATVGAFLRALPPASPRG